MSHGQQLRRGLALEHKLLLGHLHQDEAHKLTHVQPTDHLLKPFRIIMKMNGSIEHETFCLKNIGT